MLNLYYDYNTNVDNAYIITIKGHEKSEKYSLICQESCQRVGMPFIVWDAYDGTKGKIIEPEHSKNNNFMAMLKLSHEEMPFPELACALSHISLWAHCAEINKPIVILEHDAIMVKRFHGMNSLNSIVYLGTEHWMNGSMPIQPIPIMGSHGINNRFILGCHAYAIDPMSAKNLLAYILRNGIWTIADRMIRCDLFNITHQGLYAYNHALAPNDSTIAKSKE